MRHLLGILSALLAGCAVLVPSDTPPAWPQTATPLKWSEVTALPSPPAGQHIAYGPAPEQFGRLRLPSTPGPHPVVALIHGGCWLNAYDLDYFEHWAQWLSERGYASWNIEYRRIGDAGGGWPGTFADIGAAIDVLSELAPAHDLDLQQLTVMGHSAGGHLALWAAARDQLPQDSALFVAQPLLPQDVIGLAAITNLEQYRIGPENSCHASVDQLLAGSPQSAPARYAQSSPRQLLPLGTPQVLIQGDADPIVSLASCQSYSQAARDQGDNSQCWPLPGAGHFDTGVPTPASEAALYSALQPGS